MRHLVRRSREDNQLLQSPLREGAYSEGAGHYMNDHAHNHTHHSTLQFSSAQSVSLDINDIVHSTSDLIVAIVISVSTVTSEIIPYTQ